MNEIREFFKQITGLDPYNDYQLKPASHLAQNQSVVLRMPTGSGKSESILCAYLWALKERSAFPQQMIYGLPMRNLADSLGNRFAGYQKNFDGLGIAIQHGAQTGTPAFLSDIAVATIDQIISAYACTPLGYPVRHGSIPAGAIASAFLTFDEVHTFDPERALQSALFVAEHSNRLGLPFAFLSATMPDVFVEELQSRYAAKLIDVDERDIPVRKDRNVSLNNRVYGRLTTEDVIGAWKRHVCRGSLLVVCNTVGKAQTLWQEVCNGLPNTQVILLHSRFLTEDRNRKERTLEKLLGKSPTEQGVVITTQVVEVGLDVSTNLLLTELAPADAIIQRAGRVARWGGQGQIEVFGVDKAAPYGKALVEETQRALPLGETLLDWKLEQNLVNNVLGPMFSTYITPKNRGKALFWMGEGAFSGKRSDIAKAVRDNQSCTVAIHEDPNALGKAVWQLPQVRLNVWTLRGFAKAQGAAGIWRIVTDNVAHNSIDQQSLVGALPVGAPELIFPSEFYVLSPDVARYEPDERGLVLGEVGESMPLQGTETGAHFDYRGSRRESWIEHSKNTLDVFHDVFVPRYNGVLDQLAVFWHLNPDEFKDRVAFCVALHDFGKLATKWQVNIGRKVNEQPLAHSGDASARGKLPPHATVSAYLLQDLLYQRWGRRFSEPLMCAIAHHHSVRAKQVPDYKLIPEWSEQVDTLIANHPELWRFWDMQSVIRFEVQRSTTALPISLPDITRLDGGRVWRTYTIVSRLIRLSDRMATGGSEYALLCDEEWLTDV